MTMEEFFITGMGWAGIFLPTALGAVGSILGCTRAGQAACGALLDIESGYGRLIGATALPSSQTIYGIVVTMQLNRPVTSAAAPGLFAIGLLAGIALMLSAVLQGSCVASAVIATKTKPEVFGLAMVPAAIVEGFAVFAFIFAMIIGGGIPGGTPG